VAHSTVARLPLASLVIERVFMLPEGVLSRHRYDSVDNITVSGKIAQNPVSRND